MGKDKFKEFDDEDAPHPFCCSCCCCCCHCIGWACMKICMIILGGLMVIMGIVALINGINYQPQEYQIHLAKIIAEQLKMNP